MLPYDILEYIFLFISRNTDSINICSVSKYFYMFGKMFGNMKVLKINRPLPMVQYYNLRKMIIYTNFIPSFPFPREVEIFNFNKNIFLSGKKEKTEILTIRMDEDCQETLTVKWDEFPFLKKLYVTAYGVDMGGIEKLLYLQEVHIKTMRGYFLKEGKENIYFDQDDIQFIMKKIKKRKITRN